ncbi:MAG: hypothetical protein V1792_01600 [Pseudomonadota bacterium]
MAKLKDLASPKEVLEAIRGGALKNEVIKKYKTSEQELARLLLPLYREGDLTKEEFNDFFKGVPLRPKEAPSEPEAHGSDALSFEDEPPSAIVRSLAALPEPEPQEDHSAEPEKPVEKPEGIEEGFLLDGLEDEVPESISEEEPILDDQPVHEEEPEPAVALSPELAVAVSDDTEPYREPVAAAPSDTSSVPLDSAGMSSVLELIFAKLKSIDNRLAAIEKKLDETPED